MAPLTGLPETKAKKLEEMGLYEGQLKSIETKLALLQFRDEETANIIKKAQLSSLERQRKIVEKKVD